MKFYNKIVVITFDHDNDVFDLFFHDIQIDCSNLAVSK